MSDSQYSALTENIHAQCHEHGLELLYLVLFGSRLYGTDIEGKSDTDIRGIFLPKPETLALCEARHSLHISTGSSDSRNTAEDIDIDLWSLQHWLLKLLPGGDTGAEDLLFSPSHSSCVLYMDARLRPVFETPLQFIDTRNGKSCAEYAVGQGKKYGLKGSRLGAVRAVHTCLTNLCPDASSEERIERYIPQMVSAADSRYCVAVTVQGKAALSLCGKTHMGSTKVQIFAKRLQDEIASYGKRAEIAEESGGIDWKALSHAVRAIRQMEELQTAGTIRFPLSCRNELMQIKTGQLSFSEVENLITAGLERITACRLPSAYRPEAAKEMILRCYGLGKNS